MGLSWDIKDSMSQCPRMEQIAVAFSSLEFVVLYFTW